MRIQTKYAARVGTRVGTQGMGAAVFWVGPEGYEGYDPSASPCPTAGTVSTFVPSSIHSFISPAAHPTCRQQHRLPGQAGKGARGIASGHGAFLSHAWHWQAGRRSRRSVGGLGPGQPGFRSQLCLLLPPRLTWRVT